LSLSKYATHSYAKKACESAGYQHRKKGKTSNVLIMLVRLRSWFGRLTNRQPLMGAAYP
jgi:hypothetical protein